MAEKKKRDYITLKGECKWAKILPGQQTPPMEIKLDNKDNLDYTLQVECSKQKFDYLIKQGISKQTELRTDEETGKTFINVRAAKQRTKENSDPIVFPDLKVINEKRRPVTEKVGNGSTVLCVIEVADCIIAKKPGKALRLKCVQVLDHIVYEDPDDIENYKDLLEGEEETDDEEEELNKLLNNEEVEEDEESPFV